MTVPWAGWLHTDSFAGSDKQPVLVVGETPQRYRIKADNGGKAVKLAGRSRWINGIQEALVPKSAVSRREG